MKKAKLVFWLIIVAFVALLVFQNKDYFLAKEILSANLYFKSYKTPEIPNGTIIVAGFLVGFLLAYGLGLSERFKIKKTVKRLNETISSHLETISALRKEVDAVKTAEAPEPAEPVENQEASS